MTEELNNRIEDESPEISSENQQFDVYSISAETRFVQDFVYRIEHEIGKLLIGQEKTVRLLLAGLLSGGHVLIEGVPGLAKTMLVKLLANTIKVDFRRIQFTPDLMPSDVIGTMIFNMKTSDFYFREGPIFSNFILIDEINRSPAKTQAALFEVMEEKQITVEGITHLMKFPLFIVATQNPIEQEGTYKLPEAQLDRFIFKLEVDYPDLNEEKQILMRFKDDFNQKQFEEVKAVATVDELAKCMNIVEKVHIKDDIIDYIAKVVIDTRNNSNLFLGASPRASLAIMKAAKVMAAMNGRDFVSPDDVKYVAYSVLNHRIILNPDREIEGLTPAEVIEEILKKNEIPR